MGIVPPLHVPTVRTLLTSKLAAPLVFKRNRPAVSWHDWAMKTATATIQELIGSKLNDRFVVQEMFSQGGMSVLMKGVDATTDQPVAIRILHQSRRLDKQAQQRFETGFRAAAKLEHAGIVRPLDHGFTEGGLPFLIYPFIEASSLRQELEAQSPIAPERVAEILTAVCPLLAYAHEVGIVHRNIKPGNILFHKDANGNVQTLLTGFGISKPIKSITDTLDGLTQTNKVVGSPLYMAPEQFLSRELSAATDIYSLGCVAYLALTGTPPFEGENILALMQLHVKQLPEPIGKRNPKAHVPKYLDEIVMRMLQKDPSLRYKSANDVLADLQAKRATPPPVVTPQVRAVAIAKRLVKSPAFWAALLVIFMLGAFELTVSILQEPQDDVQQLLKH